MVSGPADDAGGPAAGGSTAAADAMPVLSPREQEVLMAAWCSIKGAEPQVDYERLARLLGLKNGHTASTILYNVKKKVRKYHALAGEAAGPPPAKPPTTPRKRTGGAATPRAGKAAKRARPETPSGPYGAADRDDEI